MINNKRHNWLDKSSLPLFIKKLIGYMGVGGIAAIVDVSFFIVAKYGFEFHYIASLISGFIPGMTVNFILCNWVIFHRVERSVIAAYSRHVLASLFSFAINLAIMFICIQVLEIHAYVLVRLLAIGIGFIVSFLGIRYFAFRDNKYYSD